MENQNLERKVVVTLYRLVSGGHTVLMDYPVKGAEPYLHEPWRTEHGFYARPPEEDLKRFVDEALEEGFKLRSSKSDSSRTLLHLEDKERYYGIEEIVVDETDLERCETVQWKYQGELIR